MKKLLLAIAIFISGPVTAEENITTTEFIDFFQHYDKWAQVVHSADLFSTLCLFVEFQDKHKKKSACEIAETSHKQLQDEIQVMLEKHPRLTRMLKIDMLIDPDTHDN